VSAPSTGRVSLPLPGHTGCEVRSWRAGDARSLVRHANNPNVARNLTDRFPNPYRIQDAQQWIARARAGEAGVQFAIAIAGEAVGGIGMLPGSDIHRRSAELGYWLGEAHWGRGIVTAAVCALTAWAFEHLDLARIQAGVLEWNPASCRVLEKAGYTLEARLRQHATKAGVTMDEFRYVRLREEPVAGGRAGGRNS